MPRRSVPPLSPRHLLVAVLAVFVTLLGTPAGAAPRLPAAVTAQAAQDDQISWGAAPADTSVGKGRSRFVYDLAPGARVTDAIAVVNRSDATIKLRVYASDAFTTPSGGMDLLSADKKPVDVGAWTKMKSTTLTLKSQQSATVPFTLTVPADATPGDHTGGIVTSLVTESQNKTVRLDRRLGSRVYLRVTGPLEPALTVSALHADYDGTLDPTAGGALRLTYTVTNTGNVRLKAHQLVKSEGLFGLIGQQAHIADLPEILPGNSLTRTVDVRGIWPTVRLDTDLVLQPVASDDQPPVGVGQSTAGRSLWAWPWGQLIVLGAVAVAACGTVLLRRRHRRQVDRAVSDAVAKALEGAGATQDGHPTRD